MLRLPSHNGLGAPPSSSFYFIFIIAFEEIKSPEIT
jgi:hypothetical protein